MLRFAKIPFLRLTLPALVCFLALHAATVSAVELKGQISSSLYGYERAGETHWRPYLGMSSTALLMDRAGGRRLTFRSSFRWTSDLSNQLASDPNTYIYDAYLKLTGYPSGSSLYLGRQFVYSAVGSGLIDGLRFKYRPWRKLTVDLYGGSRVRQEQSDKIQNLADDLLLGGRIGYQPYASTRVGLNYQMNRDDGARIKDRLGIDLSTAFRQLDMYGRIYYDAIALELGGALARISARTSGWYLSAELNWRQPSVRGNSIFSLVDAQRYFGIRTEVTRNLGHGYQLVTQLHNEILEDDDSWRTVIGIRTARYMLSWYHREGHGGSSDGLRGYATVTLSGKIEAYWSGFLSGYKIQAEQLEDMDAYASSLGLQWYAGSGFKIRLEGQYMKNAVDKSDARIYLNISRAFQISGAGSNR